MSLKLGSTTAQYWSRPVGLTAATFGGQTGAGIGWSFCCWVRLAAPTNTVLTSGQNSCIAYLGTSSNDALMGLFTDYYNNIYVASVDNTASDAQYAQNNSYITGQWCCVVGLFPNNGYQQYYSTINGATLVSNTTANTNPTTLTSTLFGFQSPATNFGAYVPFGNTNIAEFCVWNGLLGAGDAQRLIAGANPMSVRRMGILQYYPLRVNLQDYGPSRISLTPAGSVATIFLDHPPVQNMPLLAGAVTKTTPSPSSYVYMMPPW